MLPLTKSGFVTLLLFSFTWTWNDYINPLIYCNKEELLTLTVGLQRFQQAQSTHYALIMAGCKMCIRDRENTLNEVMTVGKALGYITVYIDAALFSDIVAEDAAVYTKRFFLLDENNRIISCRNKEKIGETFEYQVKKNGYITVDGADYVMAEKKIENRGWNYICLTEQKEVTRDGTIVSVSYTHLWRPPPVR